METNTGDGLLKVWALITRAGLSSLPIHHLIEKSVNQSLSLDTWANIMILSDLFNVNKEVGIFFSRFDPIHQIARQIVAGFFEKRNARTVVG